ncbi:MAG: hypothetical protein DRQ35_05825 [Gammaproteobacteria bacterium]|nr:MAG: hypothetical protein DRQ35_05825 [Gammaproteobacteria bacterium]
MNDWMIISKFGPAQVFVIRNCTRQQAINQWENNEGVGYEDDMDGDYILIKPIPQGDCVRVDIEVE